MKKLSLMLVALALGLTACPATQTPTAITSVSGTVVEVDPNTPPIDPTTTTDVSLKTVAWTGGAGTVTGSMEAGTTLKEVTSGTLNANGSFSLNLPSTVDASMLVKINNTPATNCTGQFTLSNPDALIGELIVVASGSKTSQITPETGALQIDRTNKLLTITTNFGTLMYADRDIQVSGTSTCTPQAGNTVITKNDVKLVKGWNLLSLNQSYVFNGNEGTTTLTSTLTSGSLPTDKWVFNADSMATTNLGKSNISNNVKPLHFLR
ncbi:hypothetical protein Dxin01_02811 [Deinococcus xinjiangensis]|uniref:Uncharacterized protein n=1 Tax=Deinococcus xinjiangensis TaxID=457454 RepID=A0ABP9VH80_9DEIO